MYDTSMYYFHLFSNCQRTSNYSANSLLESPTAKPSTAHDAKNVVAPKRATAHSLGSVIK